jgi:hypothetical protein
MSERTASPTRLNIAEQAQLETVGHDQLSLSPDQLPWFDEARTINTSIVESPAGTFQFGNIIGGSRKLAKIATDEMQGRVADDDRLNGIMYTSIQAVMNGNPGAVKRMRNAPQGTDIYYGGLSSGARVYFVDAGKNENGMRIFLKAALCGSKNSEPRVLATLSGRKNERVK